MFCLLAGLSLYSTLSEAFMQPHALVPPPSSVWTAGVPCLLNNQIFTETWMHQSKTAGATIYFSENLQNAEFGRYVLLAVTIAVPVVAVAKFMYSSYIIPEAAKQLENETKELAPKLWKEVKDEFEDGQILEQRPDLMEQLFKKIQPYLLMEIAERMKDDDSGFEDEEVRSRDPSESEEN